MELVSNGSLEYDAHICGLKKKLFDLLKAFIHIDTVDKLEIFFLHLNICQTTIGYKYQDFVIFADYQLPHTSRPKAMACILDGSSEHSAHECRRAQHFDVNECRKKIK